MKLNNAPVASVILLLLGGLAMWLLYSHGPMDDTPIATQAETLATAGPSRERVKSVQSVPFAEAAPSKLVTFRVGERGGTPVCGAEVFLRGDQAYPAFRVGITGDEGHLQTHLETLPDSILGSHGEVEVIATCAGYKPASRIIESIDPAVTIQVSMTPSAGSITGRVLMKGGDQVGEGISIIAWPTGRRPPLTAVASSVRGDPLSLVGKTNKSGDFVIDGLSDESYSVIAGGSGFLGIEGATGLRPGARDVRLLVSRVYVAAVRIIAGDDDIQTARELWFHGFTMTDDLRSVETNNPLAVLAASQLYPSISNPEPLELYHVFVSDLDEAKIGPLEWDCSVPGYSRVFVNDVWAYPIGDHPIYQQIKLTKTTTQFGDLRIQLRGVEANVLAMAAKSPSLGMVQLHPVGIQALYMFGLRVGIPDNEMVIKGVPVGSYTGSFSSGAPRAQAPPVGEPPMEINVTNQRESIWQIDGSRFGHIGWTLTDEFGGNNPCETRCEVQGDTGGFSVSSSTSQGCVFFVNPGAYRVRLSTRDESWNNWVDVGSTTCVVEPGGLAQASFTR